MLSDSNLKIDLVVGTSGGAINALTVAAGATSNQSTKRAAPHSTWQNFGQTEILKPSDSFRRLIGVTVGILFSFFLIYVWYLLRRYLLFRKPKAGETKSVGSVRRSVLGFCDCWWTAIRPFVDSIFIRSESRVRGQVSVSESQLDSSG
jgi:hypothetical protein